MQYPIRITNKERLIFSEKILEKLKVEYKDKLLAVGIYGSVTRGEDMDYSDIEMLAVIKGAMIDQSYEGMYKGLKWEVDVVSEDRAIEEIYNVNIDWPLYLGIYLDVKPVYDSAQIFSKFKREFVKLVKQDFKKYIRQVFINDIYEQFGKFFNIVENGSEEQIRFLSFHLFNKLIGFVGLINKAYYGSAANRAKDSMALTINFVSFRKLGEMLLKGEIKDVERINEVVKKLFEEILNFMKENRIKFDSEDFSIR
ncbi:MAG: kanamycin nucleotidyltransferase C-terminal domain-containing protein [Patescibacteria group bacterium]|nr:kanamycin nucleotidyltransferase C-terminal domain-containing protein [Patescibacteria group bacterium]